MPPEDSRNGDADTEPAAPAALIGVGATGGRLVARVRARFDREGPPNAGGLVLLASDGAADALAESVRQSARRLMRQRAVSALEERFAIRRPARRFLSLHLVFAAALAETDADTLLRCLKAAFDLEHPAAGMEVVFLLDVTGADGGVAPSVAAVLSALEDAGRQGRERQSARWSASARFQVLLAHPHRADGSRLDHPCLAVPARAAPPQNELPEDEFEETLAAVLAGHLASGPFFDRLGGSGEERPFALWGWARDVLPRERILEAVAERLTADALERTAQPEPGAAERTLEAAAALIEHEEPDAWRAWVHTRDDVLLDRRALLRRLLLTDTPGAVAVEDAPPPPPPRRSWYAHLLRWFFGDAPSPSSTGVSRPLSVRLALPSSGWQSGDPKFWPEALRRLDEEGARSCDAVLEELRALDRPRHVAEEVCVALARCVDVCVRRHLGGAEAGREIIDQAQRGAAKQIKAAGTIPFAAPFVPDGAGLPLGAGFAQAWQVYQERCARQPAWPAALSAGLSCGALGVTALATFGLPALLLGWPFAAASVLVAAARQGLALRRLTRLGDYLLECVQAKYGRRLLEWAEQAAGAPKHDGVYQAVLHYLQNWERPAVEQFEAEREAAVARLRQPQPFPPPSGTDGFLADVGAASDLYAAVREAGGEAGQADDARTLLRRHDVFADWRAPTLDKGIAAARPFLRQSRLADWERGRRTLGEFLRGLVAARVEEPRLEAAWAAWVRGRMDRLALRAVPLALLPPSHPERDDGAGTRDGDVRVSVTVAAPASLEWKEVGAASAADPTAPPVDSGVQDLIAWFGDPSPASAVLPDETDEAACLVLLSGLSTAESLSAFPQREDSAAAALPVRPDVPPVNGSNGHARRPVPAEAAREAAPEGGMSA